MCHAFLKHWTPWVAPGMHLMSLHLVFCVHKELCVCAFAQLGVGPYCFPIQERYLGFPLLSPHILAKCTAAISDCRIDKLDPYLATSKCGEQTHVCIPPDDVAKKVPRLWNYLPVVAIESYIQDTTDLLENSLESLLENTTGGGPEEEHYRVSGYGRDVKG
jgi:hypothetical protein